MQEMNEIREELRLIRQAVARTMDMLAELAAAETVVSLTEKGARALAESRSVAPLVAHVHEVKAETKAEEPKPEQAAEKPQPVAEPEKAEAPAVPTDLPGMRQALAAIVGGPTFTPKQKEDLKAIFMRYGCTLLKEIPAEAYGDVLASFRKAVEVK
jgi:hypothetical protein